MFRIFLFLMFFSVNAASAVSITDRYSSFWILGDSLSDNGNVFALSGDTIPSSPPYFDGRFSNGPVWSDYIGDAFANDGKPTGNFAFGGAAAITNDDLSPDLQAQLGLLSGAAPLFGERPLAAVWFGGNDLSRSSATDAAEAVAGGLSALMQAGINDILLFNLPEFSPESVAFNSALASQTSAFRRAGLSIIDVDTPSIVAGIAADPTSAITNFTDPCVVLSNNVVLSVCTPSEAMERFLFDSVHPNAEVHLRIAQTVEAELAAVPLPGALGTLLMGLLFMSVVGRFKFPESISPRLSHRRIASL